MPISICVSKNFIYAIEATVGKKSLSISSFKSLPIENSLYSENQAIDEPVLTQLIEEVTSEMKSKNVVITNLLIQIISNEHTLPYEKNEAKMRNIIYGETSQKASLDSYVMDFSIISKFQEKRAKKCRLYTYLVPKNSILSSANAIKKNGKKAERHDVAQNAIFKLVRTLQYEEPVILANLSAQTTTAHLFNPPDSIMSRSTTLSDEEMNVGSVNMAIDQISKMIQYQSIKQPDRPIEKVLIFGDLANPQTAKNLADSLDKEVALFLPPSYLVAPVDFDFIKNVYNVGALLTL